MSEYFFSNSGAEIVEAAVKLSKQATKRQNVIVFSSSFHGRTHLTMAMTTSKTIYRIGYQPLVSGIFVTPYPYAYQLKMSDAETTDYCLHELKRLLKSQTAPEETACIVMEPVLGEGGYVVPPVEFMRELRALCDQHGILLVADEVQSGVGRTGKWFALEHFGVQPDVLITAKGIASGMPLSALVTRQDLMAKWITGIARRHVWRQCRGLRGSGGDAARDQRRETAGQRQRAQRTIAVRLAEVAAGLLGHRRCARQGLDGGDGVHPGR